MEVPEIDPETAAQHLEEGVALFMDVRDPASYEAARIPGAVHVSDRSIEDFLQATDRTKKIIVYCYHGHSSLGGAAYLLQHGFQDVSSLTGGFEHWRAHHPLDTTESD